MILLRMKAHMMSVFHYLENPLLMSRCSHFVRDLCPHHTLIEQNTACRTQSLFSR